MLSHAPRSELGRFAPKGRRSREREGSAAQARAFVALLFFFFFLYCRRQWKKKEQQQKERNHPPRAWRSRSSLRAPETTITRRVSKLARKGGKRGFQSSGGGREGGKKGRQDVACSALLAPLPALALFFFVSSSMKTKTKNRQSIPEREKKTHHGASDAGGAGGHGRAAAGDGSGAHRGDAGGESKGHRVDSGGRR